MGGGGGGGLEMCWDLCCLSSISTTYRKSFRPMHFSSRMIPKYSVILHHETIQLHQSDIDLLNEWSEKWQLKFNTDKYHVISLGKFENIMYTHRYMLNDEELEHVFEEKDLEERFRSHY